MSAIHTFRTLAPVLALLCWPLAGCENWPLYLHLPDPFEEPPPTTELDLAEDTELADDEVQDLGSIPPSTRLTIEGESTACGFDPEDDRFDWPEQPVDLDGDGEADAVGAIEGWYAGDVDIYGLASGGEGWLAIVLDWENAPEADANAPYQPADEDGAWSTETDLDFVVFGLESGVVAGILSDVGFSPAYPQQTTGLIRLADGEGLAVAVACHHAVASPYTLVLDLAGR